MSLFCVYIASLSQAYTSLPCYSLDLMQNVKNIYCFYFNSCRFLDEKEKGLNEALNNIQVLKRELAGKDTEVG